MGGINMSTLIAFASKYGFTKTCAEILGKKLEGKVDICDLRSNHPDLTKYDKVIIGGSIYAGKIRKPVMSFCSDNQNTLKDKKTGFFICGMAKEDDAQKQLESSFPKELLANAAAKGFFGGECNYDKMNFIEKFIMKKITGSDQSQSRISEENITRFAGLMR
jgi:menaquinone-dependent protoporphyrinogen oxidase